MARSVASQINERYERGGPSNRRSDVGVFISQLDIMHDPMKPWLPCPVDDASVWCWFLGDRIPGSIISRSQVAHAKAHSQRALYDETLGGFVVSPEAAVVNCAYSGDASTQGEHTSCLHHPKPGPCLAGCSIEGNAPVHCTRVTDSSGCSWPPTDLESMLIQQRDIGGGIYNEIVFNVDAWVEQLPRTVEAVFVQLSQAHSPEFVRVREAKAREAHRRFLAEYNLPMSEVPLLAFDPNASPAFRDISDGADEWLRTRKEAQGLTVVT